MTSAEKTIEDEDKFGMFAEALTTVYPGAKDLLDKKGIGIEKLRKDVKVSCAHLTWLVSRLLPPHDDYSDFKKLKYFARKEEEEMLIGSNYQRRMCLECIFSVWPHDLLL
jgi:hypothetical protein